MYRPNIINVYSTLTENVDFLYVLE